MNGHCPGKPMTQRSTWFSTIHRLPLSENGKAKTQAIGKTGKVSGDGRKRKLQVHGFNFRIHSAFALQHSLSRGSRVLEW